MGVALCILGTSAAMQSWLPMSLARLRQKIEARSERCACKVKVNHITIF